MPSSRLDSSVTLSVFAIIQSCNASIRGCSYIHEKKRRDLIQSYDKSPCTTEKFKKHHDNIKTPPKTSIADRMRTDLGRSVGVTTANPTRRQSSVINIKRDFGLRCKQVLPISLGHLMNLHIQITFDALNSKYTYTYFCICECTVVRN